MSESVPKIDNPYLPSDPNPIKDATTQAVDEMQPADYKAIDLEARISALEIRRVNLNTDIIGLFETVSAAPSGVPHDVFDQFKIYKNGATLRFYVYDVANRVWRYATLT